MAEPRILVFPFRSTESAFPRHCERGGASLTVAYIVQDVAQDPEDGSPDKIGIVIIANQAEHLVLNQENYQMNGRI